MRRVRPKPISPEVSRTQQENPDVGSSSRVCSTVVGSPDWNGNPGPGIDVVDEAGAHMQVRGCGDDVGLVPKVVVMSVQL
jgi:hypothetical protein